MPSCAMQTPDANAGLAPGKRDGWHHLAAHTEARIALGRAGGSLRTSSLLEFNVAHARARDAVHATFEVHKLVGALGASGIATEVLSTAAPDRASYLVRPELGRRLSEASRGRLESLGTSMGPRDLAVIISDGLSATAAGNHAAQTVVELSAVLTAQGWTLYPVFIVPLARVKVQDEVGSLLGARHSLILLGERPGLSAHDSLGAYLTFEPRADRTDADRNCVSNIRGGGLAPPQAAAKLARMLLESRRLGLSGTGLRDE
jgi:ethanolamine ammonia-lyase small subunit